MTHGRRGALAMTHGKKDALAMTQGRSGALAMTHGRRGGSRALFVKGGRDKKRGERGHKKTLKSGAL